MNITTIFDLGPPNFFGCYRAKIWVNLKFIGRNLAIWPHGRQKAVFQDAERRNLEIYLLLEFSIFLQTVFCKISIEVVTTN